MKVKYAYISQNQGHSFTDSFKAVTKDNQCQIFIHSLLPVLNATGYLAGHNNGKRVTFGELDNHMTYKGALLLSQLGIRSFADTLLGCSHPVTG